MTPPPRAATYRGPVDTVSTAGPAPSGTRVPWRWPALLLDVGLPVALMVVGLAEVWVPFTSVLGEGSQAISSVVVVVTFLLLTVRRRWPVVGLAVLGAWLVTMLFVSGLVLFWGAFVPMVLAVFSLARYGRGRLPVRRGRSGGRDPAELRPLRRGAQRPRRDRLPLAGLHRGVVVRLRAQQVRAPGRGLDAARDRRGGGGCRAGDGCRRRRAHPDRPRAARRRRALGERDGGASRCGRAGGGRGRRGGAPGAGDGADDRQGGAGGDAARGGDPARDPRGAAGRALAAAGAGSAQRPGRRGARGRPRGRPGGRRTAAAAAGGPGPRGLPGGAGGPDQRAQARGHRPSRPAPGVARAGAGDRGGRRGSGRLRATRRGAGGTDWSGCASGSACTAAR